MNAASGTRSQLALAVHAAEDKKAENIAILQMDKSSSAFTDYFLIASGSNPRQVQAIADEVELRLKNEGLRPTHVEGYNQAEWVLIDYVDFVVHVFSEKARKFYDLERLWKSAERVELDQLEKPARKPTAKKAAKRTSAAAKAAPRKRTPAKRKSS